MNLMTISIMLMTGRRCHIWHLERDTRQPSLISRKKTPSHPLSSQQVTYSFSISQIFLWNQKASFWVKTTQKLFLNLSRWWKLLGCKIKFRKIVKLGWCWCWWFVRSGRQFVNISVSASSQWGRVPFGLTSSTNSWTTLTIWKSC